MPYFSNISSPTLVCRSWNPGRQCMTDHRSATASLAHPDVDVAWHALTPSEVASRLDVDIASGLSSAQAQERLKQYGPNALAAPKAAPIWKQFLKHYRDYMCIIEYKNLNRNTIL